MPEGDGVGQGLQAQIAHPEATVALGPVLKHVLHAVAQRAEARGIDPLQIPVAAVRYGDAAPVRRALGHALGAFDDEPVFGRGVHHGDLQIAEGVAPRKRHPGRQQVHVDVFLLDPAAGEPAVIFLRVLAQLHLVLGELQLEEGRCIRMAAGIGELQRHIADHVLAEIEAQVLALAQRQMRQLPEDDLVLLGAVALLELEAADGPADLMPERGPELSGSVQQPGIPQGVKVFNDRNERHIVIPQIRKIGLTIPQMSKDCNGGAVHSRRILHNSGQRGNLHLFFFALSSILFYMSKISRIAV